MHPLLERPVSFRLTAQTFLKYEVAAAQLGMRLSQYLRYRLEAEDTISDQMTQLRITLLDSGMAPATSETLEAVSLELLLLIRRTSPPGDLRAVHYELERQGLKPWAPAAPGNSQPNGHHRLLNK